MEIPLNATYPCGPLCEPYAPALLRAARVVTITFVITSIEFSESVPLTVTWNIVVRVALCVRVAGVLTARRRRRRWRCPTQLNMDFSQQAGSVDVTLDASNSVVNFFADDGYYKRPLRFWVSIVIAGLALISLILVIKVILRSIRAYRYTKRVLSASRAMRQALESEGNGTAGRRWSGRGWVGACVSWVRELRE